MKSSTLRFQGHVTLLLVLFCTTLSTHFAFGQEMTVVVGQEEAVMQAKDNAKFYGFENVYVSNEHIHAFLNDTNCTQVRFYTALNEDGRSQSEILVGLDRSGNEMPNYLKSQLGDARYISQEEARTFVENSKTSRYTTVVCSINTYDLKARIMEEGSNGIHIKPGINEGQNSLVWVAASLMLNGESSEDSGSTYLRSAAPCPVTCGDGFLTNLND